MIAFEGVSVAFDETVVLAEISATVAPGELCVLVGPSGSGKSTLLRLVNRLVEPNAGVVRVRGRDIATLNPPALRRSIGYVIQSIGLFPHRSVADNVATVPRLSGWSRERTAARVRAMLTLVRLDPALFENRRADELSGGQAQRVGLARALASDPDILLMDEPFGAVDTIVRRELRTELARIHAETGKTILLVTHDPGEALELATSILVLREGRLVSAGRPSELLEQNADAFVRELFGGDASLRRLGRSRVGEVLEAGFDEGKPSIAETANLHEALARMVETRCDRLAVRSSEGATLGSISLRRIVENHP
jgi:osmoprotectant transport system ATP-binding protein